MYKRQEFTNNSNYDPKKYDNDSDEMPTTGAKNGLKLYQMYGKDYDDADWDKLHTRQQQTDAQFNEASAMKPLLLPQVRESIEHNSHVSSQLTDHASKKIKAEQSDQSASTDSNTADAQESGKSSHKNDENLSDEQRRKIEELLAQNAQSTQSDPNDDSGSAAKKNPSTSSSQTKPW